MSRRSWPRRYARECRVPHVGEWSYAGPRAQHRTSEKGRNPSLNRDFFRLITRKRGIPTMIATVPLHLIYALICVAAVVIGFCSPALKLENGKRLTAASLAEWVG